MPRDLDLEDGERPAASFDPVPAYLRSHYWWAYIHPFGVRLFERQWLVNLILLGNYRRLSQAVLNALGSREPDRLLPGRTLQIACVYGGLTELLSKRGAASGGSLDVVDVLSVQLDNLSRKLPPDAPARLIARDAADLALPDASYDRALLFFLLHEQPEDVRRRTLREALRVVRPGGAVVVVDYARPKPWHPARYLWLPLLRVMEPFAADLWRRDLVEWLPEPWSRGKISRASLFGGLYQLVSITR